MRASTAAAALALLGAVSAAAAQDARMSWQDAVAELSGERTRAETCVRLLKRHAADDPVAISAGDIAYGEAKAEIDAVIGALVVALAQDESPDPLGRIEARLKQGVEKRHAFCAAVQNHVPDTEGTRNLLADVLGKALGSLITAVKDLYIFGEEEDRLTRGTIQSQIEATRWRDFGEIRAE